MFEITAELIKKAIKEKHINYATKVNLSNKLRVHAEGQMPESLITERRPSESLEIQAYRKKIYVPKTRNPIQKVLNSLEKIRRSDDWVIQYDSTKVPKNIIAGETLNDYCELNYPAYSSITNWAFSELLKQYLLDANSVVAVFPDEKPLENTEYIKPTAKIFPSSQVIYISNDYLVLLSSDNSSYSSPGGKVLYNDGKIYYIITATSVFRYEQTDLKGSLEMKYHYAHNLGYMPAFKVGGMYYKRVNNETIYDSRISSMVASLDEAAREYSDLQAEIVMHIHSEKYVYTNTECPTCAGTGYLKERDEAGEYKICPTCNGRMSISSVSPYGIHLINAARVGETNLPTPPVGYIQKDVEIAKLQDERVKQHLYDSLATLNMEFLAETPLNQSGIAKMVDKDELNNFVNSIAEDIVRILDNVYLFINDIRYSVVVTDKEKRKEMLPKINVPTKYELLNSNALMTEITNAKTNKVNVAIIKNIEIEYARKKFNTNPEISEEVQAIYELDPLYGLTEDDKMIRLNNGGISEMDYIISCNINSFVPRAVEEDKDFYSKKLSEKKIVMEKFASEIQAKENNPINTLIPE